MRGTFRALESRNYRLFFVGQTLSLIGTWMQSLAMSWLVYRITGSAFLLGTVTFAQQIPMFLVSPIAGVFTDRANRRSLLILTQSLQAAQAGILTVLVFTKTIQVWEIVALSIFVGIVNAFDTPARQAFVIEMVDDRAHLSNAIALNSTQFNLARLIGPAIAGLVVREAGEGVCFLINALSFLAVIASLTMIKVPANAKRAEVMQPWREFMDGAAYVWNHGPIRALLLLLAAISFVSGSYQVLLPVFAKKIYHGDSATLGGLFSAIALGALVSAIMLASRKSVVGLARWIVASSAIFSIGLAVLGFTSSFWTGLFVLLFVGFGGMKHMGSTNTLIQTVVEDKMRGRVMAFYAMSFVGTMPIGSFITGAIANQVGARPALIGAGILGLVSSFLFFRNLAKLREQMRPIYESKGILKPNQSVT